MFAVYFPAILKTELDLCIAQFAFARTRPHTFTQRWRGVGSSLGFIVLPEDTSVLWGIEPPTLRSDNSRVLILLWSSPVDGVLVLLWSDITITPVYRDLCEHECRKSLAEADL